MRDVHEPSRLRVSATLVDSRGKACPQPIIDLSQALKASREVELWADDAAAAQDVHAFCDITNHLLEKLVLGAVIQALVIRPTSKP